MTTKMTPDKIRNGIATKDAWVERAVLVLSDHSPAYDFKGKTFVVTGTLKKFKRKEITEKLENLGAYVASAVSRRTDILVCGSKVGSRKLDAAARYSTPTWTEDELLKNMNPPSKK